MTSIVVSSQKGGVGKTTVSINLAYAFARAGWNVLLVDSDPQGSVGLSLTRQSRKLLGFFDYLGDEGRSFDSLIVPTRMETLSMVPAGQGEGYELGGGYSESVAKRVDAFLGEAEIKGYDICIMDSAAGLFGITRDVLVCADAVLVPQQAEPLGIRSIPKMLQGLTELRSQNEKLQILGVLLTMVQRDLVESAEAANGMRQLLPSAMVMEAEVARDDLFLKASGKGVPVGVLQGATSLLDTFNSLRMEIESKLGLSR
ncbi:ParA family protein [Rubritalea tangerina]|uniref:ParA family protein n=1 Tax=Rubritalea tangerina TaxID=430798 RepID=A0ABW4ZDP6_9BACT